MSHLNYPCLDKWEILNNAVALHRQGDEGCLLDGIDTRLDTIERDAIEQTLQGFPAVNNIIFDEAEGKYRFENDQAPGSISRTISIWTALPAFQTEFRDKYGDHQWEEHFGNGRAVMPGMELKVG